MFTVGAQKCRLDLHIQWCVLVLRKSTLSSACNELVAFVEGGTATFSLLRAGAEIVLAPLNIESVKRHENEHEHHPNGGLRAKEYKEASGSFN